MSPSLKLHCLVGIGLTLAIFSYEKANAYPDDANEDASDDSYQHEFVNGSTEQTLKVTSIVCVADGKAYESHRIDGQKSRLVRRRIIPLEIIKSRVLDLNGAALIDAEMEATGDLVLYHLKVLEEGDILKRYIFDAYTGCVLDQD